MWRMIAAPHKAVFSKKFHGLWFKEAHTSKREDFNWILLDLNCVGMLEIVNTSVCNKYLPLISPLISRSECKTNQTFSNIREALSPGLLHKSELISGLLEIWFPAISQSFTILWDAWGMVGFTQELFNGSWFDCYLRWHLGLECWFYSDSFVRHLSIWSGCNLCDDWWFGVHLLVNPSKSKLV